jgi:hypothetical protein
MRGGSAGSGENDDRGHLPFGANHGADGRPVANGDPLQDEGGTPGRILHRLGVPDLDLWYPAAWRAGSDADRESLWTDLADWIDWLICAYHLPSAAWASWWTALGACEELVAMRDWHRELCDLVLVERKPPERARDSEVLTAWHRDEKQTRIDRACSLVAWHDALARCSARLAGTEPKPLLQRATEATSLTTKRKDELTADRRLRFEEWLHAHLNSSV